MDLRRVRRSLRGELPDPPLIGADDARWSVISSAEQLLQRPVDELVGLLLRAGTLARGLDLSDVAARCGDTDSRWVQTWPGEHYKLLAALVEDLKPSVAVEIGTFKGQGTLALMARSSTTTVVTYDLVAWRDIPGSALRDADFDSGRVEQRLGDLGEDDYLAAQLDTLRSADLIFIDGPKDGAWEQRAVPKILSALTDRKRLVVFDDIRLMAMIQLWWDLPYPKLDATSFGHWSGTGLLHTAE